MAKRQQITVTIEAGEASIEVNGVSGPSCETLTKNLEQALGVVRSRRRTTDYYTREDPVRQRQERT
jgi:hypothetical protein